MSGGCVEASADVATSELTAYQRAALVTGVLKDGRRLRTREVMDLTGLRKGGALKLMGHLAALHELGVWLDDEGCWCCLVAD